MKRIPCRACSGKLEPSKVVASFCFRNSPNQRFAEAFAYLSGVLALFHLSICSCTCELSATEHCQAGQFSPIRYGQQSTGPTCTQWRHKMPEMQQLSFDVHFQQLHNLLLPKYLRIKLFADGYPNRKKCKSLVPRKFKCIRYIYLTPTIHGNAQYSSSSKSLRPSLVLKQIDSLDGSSAAETTAHRVTKHPGPSFRFLTAHQQPGQ